MTINRGNSASGLPLPQAASRRQGLTADRAAAAPRTAAAQSPARPHTHRARCSRTGDRFHEKLLLLIASHALVSAIGFGLGVQLLPILTAPAAPLTADVQAVAQSARYVGQFRRDLQDSDALHWGEGTVSIGPFGVLVRGTRAEPGLPADLRPRRRPRPAAASWSPGASRASLRSACARC